MRDRPAPNDPLDTLLRDGLRDPGTSTGTDGVDPRTIRRRARRRQAARLASVGAAVLVAAVATLMLVGGPPGSAPPILSNPQGTEQAPNAGRTADAWPVELVYRTRDLRGETTYRFRGVSWSNWSLETLDGRGGSRVTDMQVPGGYGFDDLTGSLLPSEDEPLEMSRGVAPHLTEVWRGVMGLHERVLIDLDRIPGGRDLVAQLGLDERDVEAYATPDVAGCDGPLPDCMAPEGTAAWAVAHVATGFPLFVEEQVTGSWIRAVSFTHGPDAPPPLDPSTCDCLVSDR
ncbi:hypothetical protein FTX61_15245 [Nitriliruptoraceae bacterium ZYF776]|nr:hypothetical protein [Profundirhabdus halotolerans]